MGGGTFGQSLHTEVDRTVLPGEVPGGSPLSVSVLWRPPVITVFCPGDNRSYKCIKTNRNAVIVMDSDKRSKRAHLNGTKRRIIDEFTQLHMMSWVTKGKEIENYIPKSVIEAMLDTHLPMQCGQYELFPEYIDSYYTNFTGKKVAFARAATKYMTCENMGNMLGLKKQIMKLCDRIKRWNGI